MSSSVSFVFEDDGNGNFETAEIEIEATKLYVTDPRTVTASSETAVYYYLDGSASPSGSFTPGVDDNPYIINKKEYTAIRFVTQNQAVALLIINYYPN